MKAGPRLMTLNSITFVNFIYHAKQAFKSISNPNLQSIHKVNTTLHKVLQSEIPSIREDVSKLKTDVDATTEYFPAKAVVKRMDKLESRMSYIESKLDSIILLSWGMMSKRGRKKRFKAHLTRFLSQLERMMKILTMMETKKHQAKKALMLLQDLNLSLHPRSLLKLLNLNQERIKEKVK